MNLAGKCNYFLFIKLNKTRKCRTSRKAKVITHVGSGASVENNDIVLSASRIARIARRHTSSPQVLHSRMYTIFLQKLGLILSFSISWGLPSRFQFLYDDNNNLQTPQEKKKSSATDGGFSPAFRRTMTETLKSHTPGVTFLWLIWSFCSVSLRWFTWPESYRKVYNGFTQLLSRGREERCFEFRK